MTLRNLRFVLCLLILTASAGSVASLPQRQIGNEIMEAINRARLESGLSALVVDPVMQKLADEWADHLIRSGDFAHRDDLSALARTLRLRLITESVWQSSELATGPEIVAAWLDSPGHAANLLSVDSDIGGAAVHVATDGRAVAVFQGGLR